MNIWNYIKADPFFRDYLPDIKNHKHKIRGKNGRGNPMQFSQKEVLQIKKALKVLLKELSESNSNLIP